MSKLLHYLAPQHCCSFECVFIFFWFDVGGETERRCCCTRYFFLQKSLVTLLTVFFSLSLSLSLSLCSWNNYWSEKLAAYLPTYPPWHCKWNSCSSPKAAVCCLCNLFGYVSCFPTFPILMISSPSSFLTFSFFSALIPSVETFMKWFFLRQGWFFVYSGILLPLLQLGSREKVCLISSFLITA